MYGAHQYGHTCYAHITLIKMSMPQKKSFKLLSNLKYLDPDQLPPCDHVLDQNIKRINLVTHHWVSAHSSAFLTVMNGTLLIIYGLLLMEG